MATLVRLWRELYLRAPRRERLTVSALLVVAALTEGIAIALLVPLLRALGGERSAPAWDGFGSWMPAAPPLSGLLAIFLGIAFFRAYIARQAGVRSAKLRLDLVRDLRVKLYGAIASASWTFLRARRGAGFQASLTSEVDRIATAVYFALQAPARGLMIGAHVAVAALISPVVTLAAMVVGALIAFFARGYLGESLRLGERLSESYASLHHQILEFIGGLKITKSLGAESRHLEAFSRTVADVDDHVLAYTRSAANARMFQDMAAAVAVVGFIWASVALAGLGAAEVLVLALILYRLLPLVQGLQQSTQELLHMAPAAQGVFNLLDACEHARESAAQPAGATRLTENLQVRSLSFRHEGEAQPILGDASFSLKAGTLTVLSGASGAGKSTLLDLLAGLLRPSAGDILVNGEPLSPEAAITWRTQVGYLGQEPFLFHDTIRANLLVAQPDASDEDLRRALEHAGAARMIAHLPDGLDTIAGDRGARLSGGERQRIALARALLRRPSLLILDEPTSALDEQTERHVLQSVAELKGATTILIVTHRPDNVPLADQLLRVEDGRVVDTRPGREDAGDTLNAKSPD